MNLDGDEDDMRRCGPLCIPFGLTVDHSLTAAIPFAPDRKPGYPVASADT